MLYTRNIQLYLVNNSILGSRGRGQLFLVTEVMMVTIPWRGGNRQFKVEDDQVFCLILLSLMPNESPSGRVWLQIAHRILTSEDKTGAK